VGRAADCGWILVPRGCGFFGIFDAADGRNFRSDCGLFLHAMREEAHRNGIENRGHVMLSWVVTFLIIALIAGILGFGGLAGASIEIAKIIFFIAVVLFLVSAVFGLVRGRTRV
jgi:uncharacterized membrane protein YtjA (UPF0391 family)